MYWLILLLCFMLLISRVSFRETFINTTNNWEDVWCKQRKCFGALPGFQKCTKVHDINMIEYEYEPTKLRVRPGDCVQWINSDNIVHSVLSTHIDHNGDRLFNSGKLGICDCFVYRFLKPGRYPYYCPEFPYMSGEILVTNK